MLELRGITKIYPAGDGVVEALKGIDLSFRKSEFVSVLGPSGCGKTTMLNIIGGLDQYTKGDLLINNRSTKSYKDKDWDAYRNHSIGFVFQSYNLIPHQSVLQNVEIALTVSGVSKHERKKRAKQALIDVGLGSQLNKKPSELSGGQMQRVAIARAIVNNPDIILADEPTGALDTETSVQVLDILKEIAKDRLVIMVTHNPDLAERYSTRIIKMLDGLITEDSSPLSDAEKEAEKSEGKKRDEENRSKKKPSMSFWTAFSLSLKNLFTKKGRTILTSFAGSIGIIGIALIYSVSNGTTAYINDVQEEALSSMPLMLKAQHVNMSTLLETFMDVSGAEVNHEKDAVYQKGIVYDLINAMSKMQANKNDLKAFKNHLEEKLKDGSEGNDLKDAITEVHYSYDLNMPIYVRNEGKVIESDVTLITQQVMSQFLGVNYSTDNPASGAGSSVLTALMDNDDDQIKLWQEMIPGKNGKPVSDLMQKQYDLIYGKWPTAYDEIILFADKNNELTDLSLYALGLVPKENIDKVVDAFYNGKPLESENRKWSYEEITKLTYKTFLPSECFIKDNKTGLFIDLRESDAGLETLYSSDRGIELKVVGIASSSNDNSNLMMQGGMGYTSLLTEYIIKTAKDSEAAIAQMSDTHKDIFSGKYFKDGSESFTDAEKAEKFKNYVSALSPDEKADAYITIKSIAPEAEIKSALNTIFNNITREQMEEFIITTYTTEIGTDAETITASIKAMSDERLFSLVEKGFTEQFKKQYADKVREQFESADRAQLAAAFDAETGAYTDEQCAIYYNEVIDFSDSTYEKNLSKIGCLDIGTPSKINIYASSFSDRDKIINDIKQYNESVDELNRISYTDYVGIILKSVTTIINAITYVLIAFVSISLIVSSIMIGVITLISVQERTKEIGILRAIGASKRDVSSMFNAETIIIGFTSGALGVIITYLLCIPINMVIHSLTSINNLSASLPVTVGIILTLVSMALTLVSGIIPSRSAAKKDPVVALRTE